GEQAEAEGGAAVTSQVLDRQTAALVADVVDAFGVPTGIDSAHATARALHPSLIDLRHEAARVERAGMWVEPAEVRPYPSTAVDSVTRRGAGPEARPGAGPGGVVVPRTQPRAPAR